MLYIPMLAGQPCPIPVMRTPAMELWSLNFQSRVAHQLYFAFSSSSGVTSKIQERRVARG